MPSPVPRWQRYFSRTLQQVHEFYYKAKGYNFKTQGLRNNMKQLFCGAQSAMKLWWKRLWVILAPCHLGIGWTRHFSGTLLPFSGTLQPLALVTSAPSFRMLRPLLIFIIMFPPEGGGHIVFVTMSICMSVCLSVCLSVCQSVCLSATDESFCGHHIS